MEVEVVVELRLEEVKEGVEVLGALSAVEEEVAAQLRMSRAWGPGTSAKEAEEAQAGAGEGHHSFGDVPVT